MCLQRAAPLFLHGLLFLDRTGRYFRPGCFNTAPVLVEQLALKIVANICRTSVQDGPCQIVATVERLPSSPEIHSVVSQSAGQLALCHRRVWRTLASHQPVAASGPSKDIFQLARGTNTAVDAICSN